MIRIGARIEKRLPSSRNQHYCVTIACLFAGEGQTTNLGALRRIAVLRFFIPGPISASPLNTQGKSRILELGLSGSVRGCPTMGIPAIDPSPATA
jgi:hypothetical protein